MPHEKYGGFTLLVCLFVAFGGFLFGNISGVVVMGNWLSVFGYKNATGVGCGASGGYEGQIYCVSSTNKSLITSFLSVGTFFGALSGAFVADYFGRRGGIIVASSIFIAGAAIQTGAENVAGLVVGRVVAGLGVGLISMLVPMYQAEAAPPAIRGALVSFYQLAITILRLHHLPGILFSQIMDLATEGIQNTASWRVPIGLQILWGIVLIAGCLFIPESPRFLISKGRIEEGRRALARMRSHRLDSPIVQSEMAEIQGNLEYETTLGQATYADLFSGNMRSRMMCGILVQMFQQLTGVNFIFYYGTSYFRAAGITRPFVITVAIGVVNVVMTLPGIYMVDKLGRRNFLLYGAIWMSFCELMVAVFAVAVGGSVANVVLVTFTLLFIAGFAATWGPGAWVLISELYPLKLRGKAMSLATASNWFWNWVCSLFSSLLSLANLYVVPHIIAFVVPYITDEGQGNLGSKIAFIWFGTSLIAALWTFMFVPETKQWSLEQLDEMFESGLKPWKTAGWTPTGASLHGAHGAKAEKEGSVEKVEVA